MEDKLRDLEKVARRLEPDKENRKKLEKKAIEYIDGYMDNITGHKAFQTFDNSINSLLDDPIVDGEGDLSEIFETINDRVVEPGLNLTSGLHFGYIPGGGLFSSAVGDYVTAITNRYAGVYFSSPGAVAIETRMVNWMAELIGYTETAGGFLSSGGSVANLTAIVTARENANLKAADFSRAVVYLSEHAHHCVDRGLLISGMKEAIKRNVPLDEHYRIISSELSAQIKKDRENGLIPWMIVATSGTTNLGAIDPLDDIADIAKKENLWYHIDAAYGGFFLLTDEGKKKMKGIERADSVVLDPHKGMFLPYGIGALVVKDVEKLAAAHRYEADYMQDTKVEAGMYSPAELSPELSKHFRGLRMWLPLKLHGVDAFRKALEEKILLTHYAWHKLNELEDMEVGPTPDLTIFTFRWKPEGVDDLNKLNESLQKHLLEDGRVFLSTTNINHKFIFRFAILSVRTHKREIDLFFDVLKEVKNKVMAEVHA